jgi:hypothetical protein
LLPSKLGYPETAMSIGLLILLLLLVVSVVLLLVRFGPSSVDLLDLNQERRAAQRTEAEREDMEQLLELANRERRMAGRPEVTEDELRYGPGS